MKNFSFLILILIVTVIVGVSLYLFSNFSATKIDNNLKLQQAGHDLLKVTDASFMDPDSEILFANKNILYRFKLGNTVSEKIAEMSNEIVMVILSPNKEDILISIREAPNAVSAWTLKKDSNKPIKLADGANQIITVEKPSGGADIILKNEDGSGTKIGFLKDYVGAAPLCEFAPEPMDKEKCQKKFYPPKFYPSFDGKWLLGSGLPGGGLGTPAYVVSRDGSRVFKIDHYWYMSSAIWIDDNKLISEDSHGVKIITISDSGAKTQKIEGYKLSYNFEQSGLSPSRQYLVNQELNPYQFNVYDIKNNTRHIILAFPSGTDPNQPPFAFMGWNKDSNKVIYLWKNYVYVYSIDTNISTKVAELLSYTKYTVAFR